MKINNVISKSAPRRVGHKTAGVVEVIFETEAGNAVTKRAVKDVHSHSECGRIVDQLMQKYRKLHPVSVRILSGSNFS